MSREAVEKLMDLWATDPDFRDALRADPDGAVARTGVELDPDELAALHDIDWSLSDEDLTARASRESSLCGCSCCCTS